MSANSVSDVCAAEEAPVDHCVDNASEKRPMVVRNDSEEDKEVSEIPRSEDNEVSYRG